MLGGGPSPYAVAAAAQPPAVGTGADQGQGEIAEAGASKTGASTTGDAKAPGSEVGGSASGGFWPWLLRTRPGAETAVEWSLPQAAGDPLFGLPPLPQRPLPESPYQRGLDYYTRDLAELFFGRSRQIRELYQRVTAAGHANVILYYGQSGVGKSSLLDAGVAPRLEGTHSVSYARRDRALGLLGTLCKQLAGVGAPAAVNGDVVAPASAVGPTGVSLAEAWLAAEQASGKPLVLILDQVEEVFTRRNPERLQELEEFAAALGSLDGGAKRPQGALVLGFRKEHLAEIVSALRKESVAYVGQFLSPLNAEGIQEVLWGPVRSERLRAHYGLAIDPELPEQVAHDLSADPDSPVAPTLNILLRKLWAAAKAQSASAPHFSSELYGQLRRDGILLDDFLRQQRDTLAQEQPQAVASGLLLDLWAFHTTALGTSDQRDEQELQAAYGHQPIVDVLITRSKELYVLADPPGDNPAPGTRLAHDTLAPLVRRDYDQSTLPGQQARRILESRAIDWQGETQALCWTTPRWQWWIRDWWARAALRRTSKGCSSPAGRTRPSASAAGGCGRSREWRRRCCCWRCLYSPQRRRCASRRRWPRTSRLRPRPRLRSPTSRSPWPRRRRRTCKRLPAR